MRIGIDGHDLEGNRTGVGRYLFNILSAWERADVFAEHEVIVFCKDQVPSDLPPGLITKHIPPLLRRESTAVFMHWLLPREAQRAEVDVLFCPGYVAPITWNKPFVVTLHDIIYEARPELFRYHSRADALLLRRFSRRSAQRAATVLVPSHFTASEVMAHYDIPAHNIVVTPLAPDPRFSPERDRYAEEKVLQRLGINGPFFLSVGTIQTRRHIPECVDAFVKAAADEPTFQYLVAGGNQTDPFVDIEALVAAANAKLKRRDAVLYTPFAGDNDLPHLYRAAAGLLWLSEYEGFGLPPVEAQASGCPVITSGTSSLPEAVGECALFVTNPEDVDAITNEIERLISNGRHVKQLEKCGPEHAANFSWDKTAEQTLAALVSATGS